MTTPTCSKRVKLSSLCLKNQSGQGVIEYILVLVVTVGIILGVVYQINDAFRVWASNYFGEYLTCLLETGELPSLGGESSGICAQQFAEFSILEGRPLIGSGVEGGQGQNDKDGQNRDRNSNKGNSGDSPNSSGGAARPGMATSSTTGRLNRFRASPDSDSKANTINSSANKKDSYTGSTDGINVSQIKQRNGKSSYVAVRRISGVLYGSASDNDEESKKTKIAPIINKKTAPNRRKLMKVEPQKPKHTEVREVDDFTIGSFFRFLIIAAIIIILILLLVLQGGEIRKSMGAE